MFPIHLEFREGNQPILMCGEPILYLDPARREGDTAPLLRHPHDPHDCCIGDPMALTYFPDFGVLYDGDVAMWAYHYDPNTKDFHFVAEPGYAWYRPGDAVAKAVDLCKALYALSIEEGSPHQWDLLGHDHFAFARLVAKTINQPLNEDAFYATI